MTSSFEVVIDNAAAQDLFFIERAVPNTKVVEQRTYAGTTSFGMPGFVEAVIVALTVEANKAAVAWVVKNRNKGRMTIRRRRESNGAISEEIQWEWDESENSDKAMKMVEKWLAGSAGIAVDTRDS